MKKQKTMTLTDAQDLARIRLIEFHDHFESWAAVSEELDLNKGLLCAIANGKRKASKRVLEAMKISFTMFIPAPACSVCGIVHVSKRCPKSRKQFARWRDLPVEQLRWAIENRKEYNP